MKDTKSAAKKLKTFLAKIAARNDLHFIYNEVRGAVDKTTLDRYKNLPESLLDFYSIMNGCDVLAEFYNDRNLSIGLRIPPIERAGEFRYPPKDEYNFPSGYQFIPLERIEPNFAFYYLLEDGCNVSEAEIVAARPGEESEFIRVAPAMDSFIERAMECGLASGWAYKYTGENPERIKKIRELLASDPEEAVLFQPGARVKVFGAERGTIIKETRTEGEHRHFGRTFILVDMDLSGRCWLQPGVLKKLSNKKDIYENAMRNPDEFVNHILSIDAEESAGIFFRIGSDPEPCFTGFAKSGDMSYHGLNSINGMSIPKHSYRYAAVFSRLPFKEAAEAIISLVVKWTDASSGRLVSILPLKYDGSEYEKKENDRPFNWYTVLFTMTGAYVILYILNNTKQENISDDMKNKLIRCFEKISREKNFPSNGGYPTSFKKTMDSFNELFSIKEIKDSVLGYCGDRSSWMDELGLESPYPFREC